MVKKATIISLGLLLAIPFTGFASSQIANFTVDKAVEEVKENDLSTKLKEVDRPTLSNDGGMYLGELSDVLEVKQAGYQDRMASLRSELTAYNLVYGYWMAQQNVQLQNKNLDLAKREQGIAEKKYEKGMLSQLELLNGEISINNAEVQLGDAKQALTAAKNQLNQRLGVEDLDQEFSINTNLSSSSIKYLDRKQTKVENFLPAASREHLSLINMIVDQYEEAIDRVDDLTVIGESSYVDGINNLEKQIASIEGQVIPEDGPTPEQQKQLALLPAYQNQLEQLRSDYSSAKNSLANAKDELKDYLRFALDEQKTERKRQQQQVELLAHNYESQFDHLEDKIKLYEENLGNLKQMYEKNIKMFENGLMTETELEQVRMGQVSSELQLNSAKKDYQLLVKEFEFFKEGLITTGF